MRRIEFRPAAQQEFAAAVRRYLELGGVDVAERFEIAVQRGLQLLVRMPELGSSDGRGRRHWPLRRFPYTLVYVHQSAVLTVLAVAHQKRRPGYWLKP